LTIVLQEQRIPGTGHADAAEEEIWQVWIDVLVGKCSSVGGENQRTGKFAAARTVVGKGGGDQEKRLGGGEKTSSAASNIRPLVKVLRRR
jgi:hypothetical protein